LRFLEDGAQGAVVVVEEGGGVNSGHSCDLYIVQLGAKASGVKKPQCRKGRTYSPCGSCIGPLPT
jgi:hypothetical protein